MSDFGNFMFGLTFLVIFNIGLLVTNPVVPGWVLFWITLLNLCITSFCIINYMAWKKYI